MPDYAALYQQLGRLLENTPDLNNEQVRKSQEALHWLGRAHALVEATGALIDAANFTVLMPRLRTMGWEGAVQEIFAIIYRAFARCELKVPAAAAGAFIPVGNTFDAFTAVSRILQSATNNVLVVDPYLDETVLTEFGATLATGVTLRLLSDTASVRPSLVPAAQRWVHQYQGQRPLEVRLAPARALHDRALLIDAAVAWTLTQSLKDFARRSPAELVRADDTAALKIAAYEDIWQRSANAL